MNIDEEHHLFMIDEAVRHAADLMELNDVVSEDHEECESIYEARFHCGTCIARTVLEAVWPAMELYVDYLKAQIPENHSTESE